MEPESSIRIQERVDEETVKTVEHLVKYFASQRRIINKVINSYSCRYKYVVDFFHSTEEIFGFTLRKLETSQVLIKTQNSGKLDVVTCNVILSCFN